MTAKTLRDVDVTGKTCLVRVDFNVPTDPGTGVILDDSRIRSVLPTIHHLQSKEARIVLCSHYGRPKGNVVEEFRMSAIRQRASDWFGTQIVDAGLPGDESLTEEIIGQLKPGSIAMLENLRFDPGEEANDPDFAMALASIADIYINDAFGAAHRAHASTVGVAEYLPAVAGYLMEQELKMLTRALESEEHPAVATIGGAKVADKIQVLANLSKRVDTILIGGGMVAAFLKAQGYGSGAAVISDDDVHTAGQLLFSSEAKIITPSDVIVARKFSEDAKPSVVDVTEVPSDSLVLDIGPDSCVEYSDEILDANKIIWNGPMGVVEWPSFAEGTHAVARAVAAAPDSFKLVGGGSTVAVIEQMNLRSEITHVSTGGGASLEFLEGKILPGVAALDEA